MNRETPAQPTIKVHETMTAYNWCQKIWCCDSAGARSWLRDPGTVKRCLVAWLTFCYGQDQSKFSAIYGKLLNKIQEEYDDAITTIGDFNDNENVKFEDVYNLVKELDL